MTVMKSVLVAAAATVALSAQAQSCRFGTLVVVPAFGEVKHVNDQVVATLAVEEQDKDKAAAASRVNQKMNKGIAIVKQADPSAALKSYATIPIPCIRKSAHCGWCRCQAAFANGMACRPVPGSDDGQSGVLPKTVSAAQGVLTLNGLNFGLKPEPPFAGDQRIAATYKNLNERVAAIAKAMGPATFPTPCSIRWTSKFGQLRHGKPLCRRTDDDAQRQDERRQCRRRTELRAGRNDARHACRRQGQVQVSALARKHFRVRLFKNHGGGPMVVFAPIFSRRTP